MTNTRIPGRTAALFCLLLCLLFALLTSVVPTVASGAVTTVSAESTNGVGSCC